MKFPIFSIFPWFNDMVQHIPTLQRRANMLPQAFVTFCSTFLSHLDCTSHPGALSLWGYPLYLMVLGFLLEWNYQSRQWILSLDLWTIKLARLFALPSGLIVSWLGKRWLASSAVSSKCMKRKLTPNPARQVLLWYYYLLLLLLLLLLSTHGSSQKKKWQQHAIDNYYFTKTELQDKAWFAFLKMLLLRRRLGFFKTLV